MTPLNTPSSNASPFRISSPETRLGVIEFMNTIPVYTGFIQDANAGLNAPCQLIYRNPATLNGMIHQGELDISPVSSAYYLKHRDQLILLPDLSVSSPGAAESVLFLSRLPVESAGFLAETPVIPVPDDSETSVNLLAWLLEKKTGQSLRDRFQVFSAAEYQQALSQFGAALVIGDNALKIHEQTSLTETHHLYDLSSEWKALTGLPFVFAVWVARRTWAENQPSTLRNISQALVESRKRFFNDAALFEKGMQKALAHSTTSEERIQRYFTQALTYELNGQHIQALELFSTVLGFLDSPISTDFAQPVQTENRNLSLSAGAV